MYILYLDDAGTVGNADERFFVLAGIAVFERQIFFLQEELNALARRTTPGDPDLLEFHGTEMLSGRKRWRNLGSKDERRARIEEALRCAFQLRGRWALFGAVVDKAKVSPEDPVELAFEHLIYRFDRFLGRMHNDGNTQRGLIVLDRSTRETRLQTLATEFRQRGHRWGSPRNLVDVPFFVDSKATRLIQYADLVAYSLWRANQHEDRQFLQCIADRFDVEGGVRHGLVHVDSPD